MSEEVYVFKSVEAGSTPNLSRKVVSSLDGSAKNPSGVKSAWCDRDRPHPTGTATAAGTTTTLEDTARSEATGLYDGLKITVRQTLTGQVATRRIVTWVHGTTHLFTTDLLPWAVAKGDTYEIEGEPVLPLQTESRVVANAVTQSATDTICKAVGVADGYWRLDFGACIEWVPLRITKT